MGQDRALDAGAVGEEVAGRDVLETGAFFGVGDTLQHVRDRLPADVTLTNPLHPLVGEVVRADHAHRFNGDVWLVVGLPDGYPARVRVGDTDLLGTRPRLAPGTTVLSVAGIRRLRKIVACCEERAGLSGVQA